MRKDLAKKLLSTSVQPRPTIVLTLAWMIFLTLLLALLPVRSMEARVISPALFHIRELLGLTPTLSEKIKIFAVDDVSVNFLDGTELNLKQWSDVLTAIDSKNPRAIIVDALFGTQKVRDEDAVSAIEKIGKVETPIYTGAFPSNGPIFGRKALELDTLLYKESSYVGDMGHGIVANFRSSVVYGAAEPLQGVLNRTGHLLYGDNEGSYYPFLGLKGGRVLPHIMLLPFSDTTLDGASIRADGASLRVAADGSSPINFGRRSEYDARIKPLVHLLNPKWQDQALSSVEEGDYVVIIPMFYTGNSDFKPSPIGLIPGAYSHIAVLNSLLQNQSLSFVEGQIWFILSFCLLMTVLAIFLSPFGLLSAIFLGSLLWALACIGLFLYQGLMVSYILPQFAILGVGLSLLLQKMQIADRKSRLIRQALEGFIKPDVLQNLQRNPKNLSYSLEARERELTIVFIDIVGFSLMVESLMPRAAFKGLQAVIQSISEIIQAHGGVVNKTLGDGLLCYFGYSLDTHEAVSNHAVQAMAAAMAIQVENVTRMLAPEAKAQPVYPLRIGINTGPVFMGNLGSGQRLDITVVGTGVNFAKRLESACRANQILIGRTTHLQLQKATGFGPSEKRLIAIKHHEEEVESWEYDPFHQRAELRQAAELHHAEIVGMSETRP